MAARTGFNHLEAIDDELAIAAIPMQLVTAWNRGDGRSFAAPFTETADFVAFEGTHLRGRAEIEMFHQEVFDTVAKGSRLAGDVHFVRLLDADRAVMHARASVTLPGHTRPSPGRESMQLFVAVREEGAWRIAAVQNSRRLTLERQQLLDHLDDLPRALQARVGQLVASFGARAVNPPE